MTEKKRIEFPNSPPLWRATSRGSCSHTYFTHPVWLPGGRGFVFTSDRTGSREAFLCEWPSGRIHQLTEGGASSPVVTLHGKSILYVNEGEIKERHLDGEENLTLAEIPPGTNSSGIPGETIDGKWIVIGLRNEEGSVLAKFPRGGGDMVPFHTDPRYMSHLIPSPGDPEMLSVAWNFGARGESPQRLWVIGIEGGDIRPVYPQSLGELVTHEDWTGDGKWLVFTSGPFERYPGSFSIKRVAPANGSFDILARGGNFWHCSANEDGSLVVADTNWPDDGIQIIDTGDRDSRTLCPSRSKRAHPHPCFSPDGRYVLFDSDMNGRSQVYVVEVTGKELSDVSKRFI